MDTWVANGNNAVTNMGIILLSWYITLYHHLFFSSFLAELGLHCYTFGHPLVLVALCCGAQAYYWVASLVAEHRL